MTDTEAVDILRAQGYTVGTPNSENHTVRIWIHKSDQFVDVNLGRDLVHLAEGRITIDDLEPKPAKTRTGGGAKI